MIVPASFGLSGGVTSLTTRERSPITGRQATTQYEGNFHRDALVALNLLLEAKRAEGSSLPDLLKPCG
jgi:hypothetical protein